MAPEAFFLHLAGGSRFCLYHAPECAGAPRGAVVLVPPFAEELNKSRRMLALQSAALVRAGFAVLRMDLAGCGDSSGDHGDASWSGWIADVESAVAWMRDRCEVPLWLWGVRSGALLASCAATQTQLSPGLLFWQPVVSGKQFMQQFLRLKVAGEMLAGDAKGVMDELRASLSKGAAVEVAGYALSPELVSGMESSELKLSASPLRIVWIEVANREEPVLSPAATKRIAEWREGGHDVRATAVSGQAFWQTTEITECPSLLDVTVQLLSDEWDA